MKNNILQSNNGYFGQFGGKFIPEVLQTVFDQLIESFESIKNDESFWKDFRYELENFSNSPTPLMLAKNLTEYFGTAKIYIKREDLNQTGAHKINNVIGQGLLAKRMGKKRVIAETGAGQHGVATATMAARLGLECVVYMGEVDVKRQRPNVFWMEKMGAKVIPVKSGNGILKDAINEAMKDWITHVEDTHYVLGTACGPHPFPEMVSLFQRVIGENAREQILEQEGTLPTKVYACVGGGSNAMGIFQGFLDEASVELIAVEAGGKGLDSKMHAARLASADASIGIAQGYKTYFIQNKDGQLQETHSISAGLDYVGVSPILSDLHEKGRVRFEAATDDEVMQAHGFIMRKEGIVPALESTHAFARCFKEMPQLSKNDVVIINQSGRGDKDLFTIAEAYDDESWKEFIINKAEAYKGNRD